MRGAAGGGGPHAVHIRRARSRETVSTPRLQRLAPRLRGLAQLGHASGRLWLGRADATPWPMAARVHGGRGHALAMRTEPLAVTGPMLLCGATKSNASRLMFPSSSTCNS